MKELGVKIYFPALQCPHGHIAPRTQNYGCIPCQRERTQTWRKTSEGKEYQKKVAKERWADPNERKKSVKSRADWAETNPERVKELKRKDYYKHWAKNRAKAVINQRIRYRNDPMYRLRKSLAKRISTALSYQGLTKSDTTQSLVGCSIDQLKKHLEINFREGMTWDQYGKEGWHVDHLRPCSSFDLADEKQQLVCFNWRNLAPLWSKENIAKADKYDPEDEKEWEIYMKALGFKGELFLEYK